MCMVAISCPCLPPSLAAPCNVETAAGEGTVRAEASQGAAGQAGDQDQHPQCQSP